MKDGDPNMCDDPTVTRTILAIYANHSPHCAKCAVNRPNHDGIICNACRRALDKLGYRGKTWTQIVAAKGETKTQEEVQNV